MTEYQRERQALAAADALREQRQAELARLKAIEAAAVAWAVARRGTRKEQLDTEAELAALVDDGRNAARPVPK